jgi:alpha-methylacyl-CoA racemase
VSIGALEPKFFAEMAQRIGLDERFVKRQYDRKLWPEMREAMSALLRGRTRDEWCALLEGSDACFAPVLSIEEAPAHAHARSRGGFIEVAGVVQPAPAPRFDRSTADAPRPACAAGAHTDAVLAEAGFSDAEIAALHAAGAALQA